MKTLSGLDVLEKQKFLPLKGKNIGILCHQASVNRKLQHILELLLPLHTSGFCHMQAVFGPQHGLWGQTQDNMIEWEGFTDPATGLRVFSLYGKHRKPAAEMLQGIDLLLIDLQDAGARYYTFIWTMALCMEACRESGIPVMVLDRPNPITGEQAEGTVLSPEYHSFVGLYPLPQRHGMTIGEIAAYLQANFFPGLKLTVIPLRRWQRSMFFPATGLPWVPPSPNMPVPQTALVYPGMCLLEATNLSEGRGTTRPFEYFGAPWIDGRRLSERLNALSLPGVYFRPVQFLPTFHKYRGEICEGAFAHVTKNRQYRPVLSAIALLHTVRGMYPEAFRWSDPPYEYEHDKLPVDILAGNSWLREMLEEMRPLNEIRKKMDAECAAFEPVRQKFLVY